MPERVLVVGAGISGLAAAFRLAQGGADVTVLEASDAVGGKMGAHREAGFTMNLGAAILPTSYGALRTLADDAGVGDQLREFTAAIGIVRDGQVHTLRASGPGMALDALRTPLLSARSKLLMRRVLVGAVRARRSLSYEDHAARAAADGESVAEYCRRRLNREIHDYVVDPLLGGLFLVDPDEMSAVDFFFTVAKMLGGKMLAYPAGMDFLCRALARRVDVRTGAAVHAVERDGDGVVVRWREGGAERGERVGGCVLATSAPVAADIYGGLGERRLEIMTGGLAQANVIAGHFALSAPAPRDDVVVLTIPRCEGSGLGVVVFEQVSSPSCAPQGKGLVSGFWYDDWSTPRLGRSDEELRDEMLPMLERVLPGVTATIELVRIERWAPSNVRSRPGMHRLVAELDAAVDPADRVQLAGDYLGFPSANGCAISGEVAARRLALALQRRESPSTTSSSSVPA